MHKAQLTVVVLVAFPAANWIIIGIFRRASHLLGTLNLFGYAGGHKASFVTSGLFGDGAFCVASRIMIVKLSHISVQGHCE